MTAAGTGRPETATVLFTDLVGSTALRQKVGDDGADELRRAHDRVLRDALSDHGGREVKSTGDGLMVVFGSAVEAVAAGEAMQQGIARLSRRAPTTVEIRVGISSGDVVWEGDDCFGTPVVEARRLCDHAQGQQVLVSEIVRLLAGSRGSHVFRPVGELELKGITDPLPAAEVVWLDEGGGRTPFPPALVPSSSVGFVGRVDQIDQLWTAWKHASAGERRILLVSGEPGVGKTRLAAELAQRAYAEGATVLFGRCDEDLAVPYQPFVEALRSHVVATSPEDLAEQIGPYGGDVERLVPQLGARLTEVPDPLRADPETERYRLFEAVTCFLDGIAASRPLVLVLDDLHWGAKPTLLMLRHLNRAKQDMPLLVIGTYRDTELDRRHPLAEVLADLRRDGAVDRVALRGLDEDEVTAFVGAAADQTIDREIESLARDVYAETEGNPFFVGQVLRHLVESGAVTQVDGRWARSDRADHVGLPEGVREVIGRRLACLDDETNAMLSVAAVIGREFDVALLTETTDLDPEQILDALEVAEGARLVESIAGPASYTFVHALVRTTLYDEIPTTRRLRMHRRVAASLERRAEAGDEGLLPSLARHYCESAGLGETDKAIRYATAAAARAQERLAYEEAGDLYERALSVLEPGGEEDRKHRGPLLIGLANARLASGNRDDGHRAAFAAAEHGRATRQSELLGDAVLAIGGVRAWTEAGLVNDQLVSLCEEALATLPPEDSVMRASIAARLGGELYFEPSESERRRALTDEAVAMARRVGDRGTLAFVLGSAHWGMWIPGNARERLAVAEEILRLGRAVGDRELEFSGASWMFGDLMELGMTERADELVELELTIADELQRPDYWWNARVHKGSRLLMEGRFDEAQQLADEALANGQAAQSATSVQMYGVAQIELANSRGGLEALEPVVLGMVEQYPLLPAWRSGLVYLYALLERREDLRPHLEILAADDFAVLPYDANWSIGMSVLVVTCALLDDVARLDRLYELLLPLREFCITAGMPALTIGSAEVVLALAAGGSGRWELADEHFERGLARNAEIGCHAWNVHGKFHYGTLLARHKDYANPQRIAELLRDCVVDGRAMGMTRIVSRAEEVATELGIELDLRSS